MCLTADDCVLTQQYLSRSTQFACDHVMHTNQASTCLVLSSVHAGQVRCVGMGTLVWGMERDELSVCGDGVFTRVVTVWSAAAECVQHA